MVTCDNSTNSIYIASTKCDELKEKSRKNLLNRLLMIDEDDR